MGMWRPQHRGSRRRRPVQQQPKEGELGVESDRPGVTAPGRRHLKEWGDSLNLYV